MALLFELILLNEVVPSPLLGAEVPLNNVILVFLLHVLELLPFLLPLLGAVIGHYPQSLGDCKVLHAGDGGRFGRCHPPFPQIIHTEYLFVTGLPELHMVSAVRDLLDEHALPLAVLGVDSLGERALDQLGDVRDLKGPDVDSMEAGVDIVPNPGHSGLLFIKVDFVHLSMVPALVLLEPGLHYLEWLLKG